MEKDEDTSFLEDFFILVGFGVDKNESREVYEKIKVTSIPARLFQELEIAEKGLTDFEKQALTVYVEEKDFFRSKIALAMMECSKHRRSLAMSMSAVNKIPA
ncbi:MAG: hypothetical protein AAB906_03420 [Patescibacteria group bacterium]